MLAVVNKQVESVDGGSVTAPGAPAMLAMASIQDVAACPALVDDADDGIVYA